MGTKDTPNGEQDTAETLCEIVRSKRACIAAKNAATHLAINLF